MIKRNITLRLKHLASQFPVISLTGPRQSGKTTLVKLAFPNYNYYSLEDPDIRMIALNDPRKFLQNSLDKGMIIDEAQRVPDLFSYIQGIVDETNKEGQFILTGSQNFLLLEKISQTLAGRVAILKLLPFTISELKNGGIETKNTNNLLFNGFYPRLYDKHISATDYYPFYIQTYVERDVKFIKNITNQSLFIRFLKICAGRIGQLLNFTEISNSCGISQITAKKWLSVLQASYIIYLLPPHHKNFNKRLVKMPKLYFYDTGLACSLLGIKNVSQLNTHFAFGQLFENFVINEFVKFSFNKGIEPALYFWRDKTGKEIDLIIELNDSLIPIEIKAGRTFNKDFLKNLKYWNKLSGENNYNSWLVYNGDKSFDFSETHILSFNDLGKLLELMNS
ncbi:MAG: ATP-binding protein [Bacteroidales bacterium]|nr:ATP-binding protein [Bacteroidales bacterium]